MIKLAAALSFIIILIIFIFQNLQVAKINFLIWSFEASLSLVIILTIIITISLNFVLFIPYKLKKSMDKKNINSSKEISKEIENNKD